MTETEQRQAFYDTDYGKKILTCIQCGTCSGSCPLADRMDYAPRGIFALIRDGDMKAALTSNTPWFCVSCYQCTVRCPQEIPVTDLMYELKQMAIEQGMTEASNKMPDMYQSFTRITEQQGRITEPLVMALYGLKHPGAAIRNAPLALKLLQRKRLDMVPQKIRDRKNIKKLLEK